MSNAAAPEAPASEAGAPAAPEPGAQGARGRPRIVAIANEKGGVGKTTTAINLGTALAAAGRPVLLLDFDPQGNASTGLGIPQAGRTPGCYELLQGTPLAAATRRTSVPGLSVVPTTRDLAAAEIELAGSARPQHCLKEALAPALARDGALGGGLGHVLIDCPPALGMLTVNALVAADAVLVPVQCEFFPLDGLIHFLSTVERVRAAFNPALRIQGVVLTMYDKRINLSAQVRDDVRAHLGDTVCDTIIPRNVRVSEAPSYGVPVLLHDFRCPGAQAYAHLAGELLRRERSMRESAQHDI